MYSKDLENFPEENSLWRCHLLDTNSCHFSMSKLTILTPCSLGGSLPNLSSRPGFKNCLLFTYSLLQVAKLLFYIWHWPWLPPFKSSVLISQWIQVQVKSSMQLICLEILGCQENLITTSLSLQPSLATRHSRMFPLGNADLPFSSS